MNQSIAVCNAGFSIDATIKTPLKGVDLDGYPENLGCVAKIIEDQMIDLT